MKEILEYPVPDGWSIKKTNSSLIEIKSPEGFVTIDIKNRCFALGRFTHTLVNIIGEGYTGKGWKQSIFSDAVYTLLDSAR